MKRWLGCGLLMAVLLGGLAGCAKSTVSTMISRPMPSNLFPEKK
jgi:hypothetical protein